MTCQRISLLLLGLLGTPSLYAAAPATWEVQARTLDYQLSMSATVLPGQAHPIELSPQLFRTLKITSIVENGQAVNAGDSLITFDLTDLNSKIEELEAGQALAESTIATTTNQIAQLEASQPLQMAALQREQERSAERLEYFVSTEREQEKQDAAWDVRIAQLDRDMAQRELTQLKDMYANEDLGAETQEAILERTKVRAESTEFRVAETKEQSRRKVEVELNRTEQDLRHAAAMAQQALDNAQVNQPAEIQALRLKLASLKFTNDRNLQQLNKLKADRELLGHITSPCDGYVMWGDWSNNPPQNVTELARALKIGAVAPTDVVMMTIAEGSAKSMVGLLPESELSKVPMDSDASHFMLPAAEPDMALAVTVANISDLPSDGKYRVQLSLQDQTSNSLPAGSTVQAVLADVHRANALMVPKTALKSHFTKDGLEYFVWRKLPDEDAGFEQVTLQVGVWTNDQVEVLDGLAAGDVILNG